MHESSFLYTLFMKVIPGLGVIPEHLFYAGVVTLLLLTLAVATHRRFSSHHADLLPDDRITAAALLETAYEAVEGLALDIIGPQGKRYLPLLCTCALFILTANVLGLFPGFRPATDNINVTAACGLTVFLAYHFFGLREHGLKYFKHFVGPIPWLAPLMIPIELIGHLARPLSLSLRLMGNMVGDHMALGIFLAMIPLLVPVPIMALGLFVALVQTFVFTLLSMVYISGAVAHGEH
jgi:F-type H+-transporting ATPase subunit a